MNSINDKINQGILPRVESLTNRENKYLRKISQLPLDEILQDFAEEYIFHSPKNIQIKLHGLSISEKIDYTQEEFEFALKVLVLKNNLEWNYEKPCISFDYLNFRATLVHQCCTKEHGSKLFLRTIAKETFSIQSFDFSLDFANELIRSKANVLIAGSTGSGKSSFTNSLIQMIPEDEHLIIAEDTYELKSPHTNTTRFLSNDFEQMSLNKYMTYSMRMRPDRIVLGEIRSHEVIPFLLALNSGHKGTISTVHANNAKEAIRRVALLYKLFSEKDIPYGTLLKLVSQNIDYVVFLEDKKVTEVIKVIGSSEEDVYFEELAHFNQSEQALIC